MSKQNKRKISSAPKDAAAKQKAPEDVAPEKTVEQPRAYSDIVDDTLDDSFPASDPPGWAGQ
jgi:hypothetical protein